MQRLVLGCDSGLNWCLTRGGGALNHVDAISPATFTEICSWPDAGGGLTKMVLAALAALGVRPTSKRCEGLLIYYINGALMTGGDIMSLISIAAWQVIAPTRASIIGTPAGGARPPAGGTPPLRASSTWKNSGCRRLCPL